MAIRWRYALVGMIIVLVGGSPATADPQTIFAPIDDLTGVELGLELVADGLGVPIKGKVAPGEPERLYVVNLRGQLTAVELDTGTKTQFLNLSGRLVPGGVLGPGSYDERGFLGVAFHPDYQLNGRFYTYTSEPKPPHQRFRPRSLWVCSPTTRTS